MKFLLLMTVSLLLTGCLGMPENIQPVQNFQLDKYLGTWHEIARLDHAFERGMTQVTANYQMREDGGVRVLNRGYVTAEQSWQEAEGKAYFVKDPTQGHLKVSFFGPFYASYVVFFLDPAYQYAFVAGPDTDYLWLLARTPQVPASVIEQFVAMADAKGFDTQALIYLQASE